MYVREHVYIRDCAQRADMRIYGMRARDLINNRYGQEFRL